MHATTPPALWPRRNAGRPGFFLLGEVDQRREVRDVVLDLLEVESFALRLATAAVVDRVDREARSHELLGGPLVVAAVRVDAVRDDDERAGLPGLPGATIGRRC